MATGLVIVLSLVEGTGSARAGEYVMRNCDVPGHGNALIGPWVSNPNNAPTVRLVDACSTGGGLSFALGTSTLAGGTNVATVLVKPGGVRSQIKLVKMVLSYSARLLGSGSPLYVIVNAYRPDGTYRRAHLTGAPGSEGLTAEFPLSSDTAEVHVTLYCGPVEGNTSAPEPCIPASGVPMDIRGMEVTLSEDAPPIVRPPEGTLLIGGVQSGVRTLTYSASDAQSGLANVDVLLGGRVVASRDLTPSCLYSDFTVCPESQDETLQIDTRRVANGTHPLTIQVRDAAGNERMVPVANAIEVANAPGTSLSDAPTYVLDARFSSSSRSTLTVPFGRRVSIRGRLTQASQPVAVGTKIEVLKKLDRRRAREVPAGTVVTGADGSFTLPLPTTRPSRTVRLRYRPGDSSEITSRTFTLRVRAASRVSASLRGRMVRFSGRVLSGPMPTGGKRVQMEGRSPGSAWTPFKIVRTNKKGRFAGTYWLRVRRPGVRLEVRAAVVSETGYGYLTARSRSVALRVR